MQSLPETHKLETERRNEILAELLHFKAEQTFDINLKKTLRHKTLLLLQHINQTSDTYSSRRIEKIAAIERALKE